MCNEFHSVKELEMKITPRQIVVAGALGAISIILGVTKLGFIPFFLGTSITIMHVPVIVGAVLEGPWVGTAIGLIFGIFSLIWAYIGPNGPGDIYFQNVFISVLPRLFIGVMAYLAYRVVKKQTGGKSSWLLWLILGLAFIAPILAYGTSLLGDDTKTKFMVLITSDVLSILAIVGIYLFLQRLGEIAALVASAVVGTLTNTILVLGMMGLMGELGFVPSIPWKALLALGITNGIPEIIAAVIITVAVVAAWKQIEFGRKGARIFRE
jgi:uncharacterized membrane protein